ncbi:MAG: MFS transporter [Ignavibacteriales bacterium]|nr:MFS transporter [Ignavibacteriales bacterium]
MSFISAQIVLPALVSRLGGGNISIGAIGVITWLGLYLPQIFAARYAQTQTWKKPWAIRLGLYQRSVLPLIILTIFLFGKDQPIIALWFFFIFYGAYQILTGMATPFWFDMYAKLTTVGLRGRLSGLRTSLAGGGAFLGAFLLTWLISSFEFPLSYTLAISVTFMLQTISIILQFGLVEEYPSRTMNIQPLKQYFEQLKNVLLYNIPYKKFLLACMPLALAVMPLSFFTVYGLKHFHLTESTVGNFSLIMVIGLAVGALANGFLADHYGNKIALISSASALGLASVLALVSPAIEIFYFVFILMGMNLGSEAMTRHNLALEYSPIEQRSTYIGLMNTVLVSFYLSGLFGGWISNLFSYHTLFIIGCGFSFLGIVLLVLMVHEPRTTIK